jgi:hypothetical protein
MIYFHTKNPTLDSLGMENLNKCYDHLQYFNAIWYILRPLDIVSGHLLYFSRFGMFEPREIWQP